MKEAVYSLGVLGFANKLLAFDKAEGSDSRVAATAYELFKNRQQKNLPGTPEEDWVKAEEIVIENFAREIVRRRLA